MTVTGTHNVPGRPTFKVQGRNLDLKLPEGIEATLGANGTISFWDSSREDEDCTASSKIATWSGYTDLLVFHPEDGPSQKVGKFHMGRGLNAGILQVQKLRNLERLAKIRRQLRSYETWVLQAEEIVEDAVGIDVSWDWASRDCYDAGMEPWEAAIECVKTAMEM